MSRARYFAIGCVTVGLLAIGCEHPGRPCTTVYSDAAWNTADFTFDQQNPPCPYSVGRPYAGVFFDFRIYSFQPQPAYLATLAVFNQHIVPILVPNGYMERLWLVGINGVSRIQFAGTLVGGSDPDQNSQTNDKAYFVVPYVNVFSEYQTAHYTASLPGAVDSGHKAIIIGPTSLPVGATSLWADLTQLDTFSYTYQWFVNGQPLGAATGATFATAFTSAGQRTLTVTNTRTDQSADTASVSIFHPSKCAP